MSPEAEKASEEAAGRRAARASYEDKGPYIDEHGAIVIPSPGYNPAAVSLLSMAGFRFYGGIMPSWERLCSRPLQGKVYSRDAWLHWAKKKYEEWFPKREETNGDTD